MKKQTFSALFVHLSKASETVDHNILLNELLSIGLVILLPTGSNHKIVENGVPQG